MKLLLVFLILSVLMLLGWGLIGGDLEVAWSLERLVSAAEGAKGWAWLVAIILLCADILLPIPGTIVMSALGVVYGTFLGGIFSALGSISAGLCGYGLGRFFKEKTARRWLGEKDFQMGRRMAEGYGGYFVALSRALPILPEVVTCMAGLLRMPFPKFCLALVLGSVPMSFLFAWIGAYGKENPAWSVAFSVGVPFVLWLVARKIQHSHRD